MKKEKNLELLLNPNGVILSDEDLKAASGGVGERKVYYIVSCFTCQMELTPPNSRIYSFDEAYAIKKAHLAQYPGHDVGMKPFPEN